MIKNAILRVSVLSLSCALLSCSQESVQHQTEQGTDLEEMNFPSIVGTNLPGAPSLQPPMLIMAGASPVLTEKHGLAAPALWDWDGDGKRDLLVGEFETNSGELFPMGEEGSTIRVYLNQGTDAQPKFASEFEWAKDTEGTIMEVPQWCCIGFTPYFYDLNDDGYQDIITGQYHPGEVTWFRGSAEGFLPGMQLIQEGDPSSSWNAMHLEYAENPDEVDLPAPIETFDYWVYSSASMGDFDDDGDFDLIIGGNALKISKNVGTKEEPRFARRELLLDINGKPLSIGELATDEQVKNWTHASGIALAGDFKTSPYVVDWDRDGTLDLLVTGSYINEGDMAVAFFKGTKVNGEHRFHPAVDLLTTADGSKALPGSGPRVFVDDWNLDGTSDLIIGASVATVNGGEFSTELSWEWEATNKVESAGKDPGRYPPREKPTREVYLDMYEDTGGWWNTDEELDEFVQTQVDYWQESIGILYDTGREHWLTMRHQGRVYVMLGTEPNSTETTDKQFPAATERVYETSKVESNSNQPVELNLVVPESMEQDSSAEIAVNLTIEEGWYIYAPTGKNAEQGMKETKVSFSLPQNLQQLGSTKLPIHEFKGSYEIYKGPQIAVVQEIGTLNSVPGEYEIKSEITYQTCNDDRCLPPKTVELTALLVVTAR